MEKNEILHILKKGSTFTFVRNEDEEIQGIVKKIHADPHGTGGSVEFMDVMEGIERSLSFAEITSIKP